jgi:hypothetical protein
MNSKGMKHETISSYADLRKMIHDALRIQHPEWIGLDGQSEMCEFYEAVREVGSLKSSGVRVEYPGW